MARIGQTGGIAIPVKSGTVIPDNSFIRRDGDGDASPIGSVSGNEKKVIGVVCNGSADGETNTLLYFPLSMGGVLDVEAGATISRNAFIKAGSDGKAEVATSGDYFFATAKTSGGDGDVIEIDVVPGGVV